MRSFLKRRISVPVQRISSLSVLALLLLLLADPCLMPVIQARSYDQAPVSYLGSGIQVTTNADSAATDGQCSLREAIVAANTQAPVDTCSAGGSDTTILLSGITGQINLTGPLPAIMVNLTIEGPGAASLAIQRAAGASGAFSLMQIGNAAVTVSGLTVRGGQAASGAGVIVTGGSLSLNDSVVENNQASSSGGGLYNDGGILTLTRVIVRGNSAGSSGGGVYSSGTLDSVASTFANNNAASSGGGIYHGTGSTALRNTTLSGNHADSSGGGLYGGAGSVLTSNVTIADNSAGTQGGGVSLTSGAFSLKQTLIANNGSGGDCYGSLVSAGHNLIRNQSCTISGDTASNIVGQDPKLGALGSNGGSTPTYPLNSGSPAIDAGTAAGCEPSDQRGIVRPQHGNCDIGAFEVSNEPAPPPVVPVDIPTDGTVVRGTVLTRDGAALPNVSIGILNHAEITPVLTHADGSFSLPVSLGGLLTVTYGKAGYLAAQRQVTARLNDFTPVEDVALVPLDAQATTLDLTLDAMQVARGSVVTDGDGTRQATVLIPAGTTAQLVMPDGSTQPISTLTLRATEYTVGDNGPETMPASLPPTSGYTYALDYSADEALAAGAASIQFSQPVYHYVENYLNFPVGIAVPVGYFDAKKSAWIPGDNGRVVKIVSITNGLADVDTDGNGYPDSGLGITDAERAQLASLYGTGTTLWRVPITHFSSWDCNWPFGPPSGALPPGQAAPKIARSVDDSDCERGSIVECQNQTLREIVPITGTPFTLNYSSERVPGQIASYTATIPLSGASVPPPLKRIDLEIDIAGQHLEQSFSADPNQTTSFTWDGRDSFGRDLGTSAEVTIRVGYVYQGVYYQPADFAQSFADVGQSPLSNNPARQELTVWQESKSVLGNHSALQTDYTGAWTIDVHHSYDIAGNGLYLGDGTHQTASSLNFGIITTVAGKGSPFGPLGDGGPAIDAASYNPVSVVTAPDGSYYFADLYLNLVRHVDVDGIIHAVAGNGDQCADETAPCGDGGPATDAQFNRPSGLALAPDGSLYIADSWDNRVRRVGTDGIITTVAGTGDYCSYFRPYEVCGDGGSATDAKVYNPSGVAVAPDGTLYITEYFNNIVRRVSTNGIITTFVGYGNPGFAGDGGPATDAKIYNPNDVAIGPDGSLYIADQENNRVRRVGTDGIITTVAGNGSSDTTATAIGDGGPATAAIIPNPQGVAVAADGTVYVTSNNFYRRIRRIGTDGIITTIAGGATSYVPGYGDGGPALAGWISFAEDVAVAPDNSLYVAEGVSSGLVRRVTRPNDRVGIGEQAVASQDGSEVYVFDSAGRHLRTLNALTGAVVYQFGYDGGGRLTSITDGDNNVTTIQRDANGSPTGILSPYGQLTTLQRDANGYLSQITNPAGSAYKMAYTSGGLLTSFTDPRNFATTFAYDPIGRLTQHLDPAGGSMTLSRTQNGTQAQVTLTTAMNRVTTYDLSTSTLDVQSRVNTLPGGFQFGRTINPDGTRANTTPDGVSTSWALGPDPRWGMVAPLSSTVNVTTPGGKTLTTSQSSTATLTAQSDPFSLVTLTNTGVVNGKTYTSVYNAASRTFTLTSPVGRSSTLTIDTQGRPVSEQSTQLTAMTYAYDSHGRLITVSQGTRSMSLAYNVQGFLASITDPLGQATTYSYDAAGRITQEAAPGGHTTNYTYDASGNLTSLTPANRPAHTYTYNPIGQILSYTAPDVTTGTETTTYTYNPDHQLTQISRPDGKTIAYTYNSAGWLNTQTIARGIYSYSYDATSGNLTSVSAPGGTGLAFAYDGFLPLSDTLSGSVSGSVSRTFNNNFRVSSLSVDGANPISYAYDNDGLPTTAGALSLTYNPQNGLLTGTSINGVTEALTYNGFAEPLTYTAKRGSTGLYSLTFTRDALGRISTAVETIGGVSTTFGYSYDAAGRLTQVTRDGTTVESYSYDANGNRTSATVSSVTSNATYDGQDRLLTYGGTSYVYNTNGDLIAKTLSGQTTQYTYDEMGNLTHVALPAGTTIDYLIDGQNRRVGKQVNGALVKGFLWQDDLRIAAELDSANTVVSRFVYASGVNVPEYMVKGGVTYRIITDQVGSVRLVVNTSTGAIVQRLDYDAWGNVTQDTAPGFQPFGFAGGLYDPDTELVRFGARDYDAQVGRWTTKDPLGFASGDTNLYTYVGSDPVNQIDPLGHRSFTISVFAGVGGSFTIGVSKGRAFWAAEVGLGLGGGLSYNPQGEFPEPELGSSKCGVEWAAYVKGSISGRAGPLSAEVSQNLAGQFYNRDGKPIKSRAYDDSLHWEGKLEAEFKGVALSASAVYGIAHQW